MNGVLNLGWWAALGSVKLWGFQMGFPLLLLHILRVGKWLFGKLEFLLMRVFVVCTSLVALWHCDCGGGEES